MSVRIYARGPDLRRQGLIDDWQSLAIKVLFNSTGTWQLDIEAETPGAALLSGDGVGVIIEYAADGVTYTQLMTGSISNPKRTYKDGANRLVISGVDDNIFLNDRLALPGMPSGATGLINYGQYSDIRSGPAETVIKQFVTENATANGYNPALAVPNLVVAPDQGRGGQVSYQARFDNLSDLVTTLCLSGGDLGWSITQVGTQLVFDVFEPYDASGFARFSLGFRNLSEFEYEEGRPTANYIIVLGANDPNSGTTFEDGVTTSGSLTLQSASANFTSANVGKAVVGDGLADGAYIRSVESSTSATMSAEATQTATGTRFTLDVVQLVVVVTDPVSIATWGVIVGPTVSQTNVSNIDILYQLGLTQLAKDAQDTKLAATTLDTETVQFLNQWGTNSKVAVEIDGVITTDVIRELDLTWQSADSPPQVKPVIGSPDARHPEVPLLFNNIKKLAQQLSYIERHRV